MQTCISCNVEFAKEEKECPGCQRSAEVDQVSTVLTGGLLALHAKTVQLDKGDNNASINEVVGRNWPIEPDSVSYNFIQNVELKFKRKNKFHSFYDNTSSDITTPLLKYVRSEATVTNFDELVTSLKNSLKDELFKVLGSVNSSSIVFTHYKHVLAEADNNLGRLLIVMVDKKSGFDFTDDNMLLPKEADHINLSAMKQAVMIDLQMFFDSFPEQKNKPYLKFIRGNSSAEYFRKGLGCVEKVDNGESLDNLYKAVEQYSTNFNLGSKFESEAFQALDIMLDDLMVDKSRSSFSLDEAALAIESVIVKDKDLKDTFVNFVNEKELPINHFIEPTKNQVDRQRWIDFSDSVSGIIAKALRPAIGIPDSGFPIEFDEQHGRISWLINDEALKSRILSLMIKDQES
ncbi:nucleoid-associated protein [Vibrio crassostreae]|uniref:nucleoid-associated protein n=1 Tax=Vibrio crassostreae TaxID=246167 RepID=UPI0010467489|nr:nucleoid-associated protein [Vibrio crassostreae]TCV31231.1 nucleoid associated protein NdpA [Vibrio crassostreae]